MKIFDAKGNLRATLPDKPKGFDCGNKGGIVDIWDGNDFVKLGRFSNETGKKLVGDLHNAYLDDKPEFILPEETT